MTFEGVPWAIGGGAEVPVEAGRLVAYAATGGADGVAVAGDLKVLPLAVAGPSVRVMKGACMMPSRAAGVDLQSYAVRNLSEEVVGITATGSGSGRSDMVIVRVEDSSVAGEPWATPTNPVNGPYAFARVLQGVPSSAIVSNRAARDYLASQGFTAIPLAGVTLPASTGTITSGMITDLRNLARPQMWGEPKYPAVPYPVTLSTVGTDTTWPGGGPTIDVPKWATHASVTVLIAGIRIATGYPANGWLHVAATGYPTVRTVGTQFTLDATPPVLMSAGEIPNIPLIAGKRVTFELRGYRNDTDGAVGALQTAQFTSIEYKITFFERTV
jgi:hypothetical protein